MLGGRGATGRMPSNMGWKTVCGELQKMKRRTPTDPAIPHLGLYPKELKEGPRRDVGTPMFTAALCTAAKTEAAKCPWADGRTDEQNVVHPHNGMLSSLKQEGDSATCHHVDEPGGHRAIK